MSRDVRFISQEEITKLLDVRELLEALEVALGNYSKPGGEGGVVQPVRVVVPVTQSHGSLRVMPGYSSSDQALATKLVSFYPDNTSSPQHQAWIMLQDPANGDLKAIMDGVAITDARTAVVSAVATKHLARPDSRILALLGSGVQARSHYKALSLLHNFDEVRIWSRSLSNAQKMAAEVKGHACSTAEEAVRDADIIATVTFATTPILKAEWVKPGAHINAVGACGPGWQEIDSQLMRSSVVYCDSREACLTEAGDIILSECDIYAEIGEVINGEKQAFWEKTTIFKSVGMAIEDVVSAKLVYDKYLKQSTDDVT